MSNLGIMHVAEVGQKEKFRPKANRYTKDVFTPEREQTYLDLIVAKSKLLQDVPFWGILAMNLRLIEVNDPSLPTLATDGMHIFYNPDFIDEMSREETMFGVAHEIFHALYKHTGLAGRCAQHVEMHYDDKGMIDEKSQERMRKFNYAADFVVNDELVVNNIGTLITVVDILHDEKFRGWSSEEVYDYLLEHPDECPSPGKSLDQHIEIEIVPDGEEGSGAERDENGNIKVKMTQSQFDEMEQSWKDSMVSAAAAQHEHEQKHGGAGCIPLGVQRMLDALVKPKLNWKAALRRYVSSVSSRKYSFSRPNKALFSQGWTLPGFRDRVNELDIAICIDTSGSVGQDELTSFVSELKGIMDSFSRYKIKAWCFDSEVIESSVTTLEKKSTGGGWDNITKLAKHIAGGGGTTFEANWEYMRSNKIKPRLLIMLTDGYPCGGWGESRYCPTMFMLIGNPEGKAPFGLTLHYDDNA